MARSRNLKPGFFVNEDLVELDFWVRILFAGLWTIADKAGRLEDRPRRIKMAIFPADNVDIEAGLRQLDEKGLICRYEVDGKRYAEVCNFVKHQNPHHQEKPSILPPNPSRSCQTEQTPDLSEATSEPIVLIPSSLIPSSLIPDSLNTAAAVVSNVGSLMVELITEEVGAELSARQGVEWSQFGKWLARSKFSTADAIDCFRLLRSQDWRTSPVKAQHVMDSLPDLPKLQKAARKGFKRPPDVRTHDPSQEPQYACQTCLDTGDVFVEKPEAERRHVADRIKFIDCPDCTRAEVQAA